MSLNLVKQLKGLCKLQIFLSNRTLPLHPAAIHNNVSIVVAFIFDFPNSDQDIEKSFRIFHPQLITHREQGFFRLFPVRASQSVLMLIGGKET